MTGLRISALLGAACLVSALSMAAHAQEPPAEDASENAAPAEETSSGAGGALGITAPTVGAPASAPVPADGAVGAPPPPDVTATEFQDWRVECYEPPVNNMRCQIVQQLVERTLDQIVLVTSLAHLPATDQTQIQMVLPLGFLLKRGVTFDVNGYTTSVGVDRCTQQGCFIEGIAAPELLTAMRRGREAQIAIVADSGQAVRIPFSLMGFTDAYRMMEAENARPIEEPASAAGAAED